MVVIIYTGDGGGKTLAAFGLAMRALGHKQKPVIIQFMKKRKTGEYKTAKKMNIEIHQFGRRGFVFPKKIQKKDKEIALEGLEFVKKVLKKRPKLLILDEINIAVAFGLLSAGEVLNVLKKAYKNTNLVLTGRCAPKEFYKIADYVIEIKDIKRPKKILEAKPGIEY